MEIGFCAGLRGEECFLASLKGMLKLWEEIRTKKYLSHIMVKIKGWFKGETGYKWYMLTFLDIAELEIEVRKRVGRRLDVLV